MKVKLLLLDFTNRAAVNRVKSALKEKFGFEVEESWASLPQSAFNPLRNQYHAGVIIQEILSEVEEGTYVVALIDKDLYIDGYNFVFGLADPSYKICIVSDARLKQEFYGLPPDEKLYLSRLEKEVLHEMGHLLGLPHCPDPKCVMHFSNCLEDTDRKEAEFCENCKAKLLSSR